MKISDKIAGMKNLPPPPIPLVRQKVKKDPTNSMAFDLRQTPNDNDSPTFALTAEILDVTPTFSDWILFEDNGRKICTGMNATTGPERFSIIRNLLTGTMLARFNTLATAQGAETIAHLDEVLNGMKLPIAGRQSLARQKRFMRRYMRKHKDSSYREWYERFTEINNLLPRFPNAGVNARFDLDEIRDIIYFVIPNTWNAHMLNHNFDIFTSTLDETLEYCERIEEAEGNADDSSKAVAKLPSNKKKRERERKNGSNKDDAVAAPAAKKTKFFCEEHGHNWSHSTSKCKVIKGKKKKEQSRQELNTMIARRVDDGVARALRHKFNGVSLKDKKEKKGKRKSRRAEGFNAEAVNRFKDLESSDSSDASSEDGSVSTDDDVSLGGEFC